MKGHLKSVQLLLINGLNPNVVDKVYLSDHPKITVFQLGRTPLHWAARNRHNEVYDFLKPLTSEGLRPDIYGISAESFFPDDISPDPRISFGDISPSSPLSLSSLTLHTISLSTTEHSPIDRNPLSPRVMDVFLQPKQFRVPPTPPRYETSVGIELNSSAQAPFLVEEKSECTQTGGDLELEWEPLDERFRSQTREESYFSLPYHEDQSDSDITTGSSENIAVEGTVQPIRPSRLSVDTTHPKSRRFYHLRRKISMMLYNTQDDDSDSRHSHKKAVPKSHLKKLIFPTQHKKLRITHSPSHNPLNDSTASDDSSHDHDELKIDHSSHKLIDAVLTPLSQSTTLSTNSDDLSTRSNWMSWRGLDLNWKGSKKNHRRSHSENSEEGLETISTIAPFRKKNDKSDLR
jgi:hypothetical protein